MSQNSETLDVLGIGLGPFNLSLAALLSSVEEIKFKFCESKPEFSWHPELMFKDASMQTTYLKDLVTAVDPTSPYTFLNYLVHHGMLYHFINTDRKTITRLEFQDYCRWVTRQISGNIHFDTKVQAIEHKQDHFLITSDQKQLKSKNICIATGPTPNIPKFARPFLSDSVFHAKSPHLKDCQMQGKRVLVVGGGQSGLEIFRNALHDHWGKPESVQLITGRQNLIPLDEGPFTNEIFTPSFVTQFHSLKQERKDDFTKKLIYASDGNTPDYLQEFYNELYMDRFYHKKFSPYQISPMRWLEDLSQNGKQYQATIQNLMTSTREEYQADIVILATGFSSELPQFLAPILEKIEFDEQGRPKICKNYQISSSCGRNRIFAMNYSRHGHGIADPQTSLMSWRSAVIANALMGHDYFRNDLPEESFLRFF